MAAKTHPGADNQIYTQAGKNRADNANHLASDQFVDGKIISLPDPNYVSDFWDIQRERVSWVSLKYLCDCIWPKIEPSMFE